MLPCTSMQGALQIAENVRMALKDLGIPHQKSLVSGRVSCSFGVATLVPDQSGSIAELIQKRMRPSIRPSIMGGIVSK